MTAAENKQRYAEYIQAIFNEARFEELGGYLADDYAIKDAPPGSAQGADGNGGIRTKHHGEILEVNDD